MICSGLKWGRTWTRRAVTPSPSISLRWATAAAPAASLKHFFFFFFVGGGHGRLAEVTICQMSQLRLYEFNWDHKRSTKIIRGWLRSQKGCWGPIMRMAKVTGGRLRSYEFNSDHMRSANITRGLLRLQKGCKGLRMTRITWDLPGIGPFLYQACLIRYRTYPAE